MTGNTDQIDSKYHYGQSLEKGFMVWIANELAEANRLKRLELKIKIEYDDIGHKGQGTGVFIIDKNKIDLEDRA